MKNAYLFGLNAAFVYRAKVGIFDAGGQRRAGEVQPITVVYALQFGEHTQPLRIAIEMDEVALLLFRQLQRHIFPGEKLLEIVLNDGLAEMSERRVANVVNETGVLQDEGDFAKEFQCVAVGTLLYDRAFAAANTERMAYRHHLQRVGEARMDVVVFGKRKHLRFGVHTAGGRTEDDASEVAFEGVAGIGLPLRRTDAFGGEEPVPVHHYSCTKAAAPRMAASLALSWVGRMAILPFCIQSRCSLKIARSGSMSQRPALRMPPIRKIASGANVVAALAMPIPRCHAVTSQARMAIISPLLAASVSQRQSASM